MRLLAAVLTAALAASGTVASNRVPGARAGYSKWHETELERWLADHDIPHPTPADRADLEALVDRSWNDVVVQPYKGWDMAQLRHFLGARGQEAAGETKDRVVAQVKANWYETEESAAEAWASAKDWILDTWTEGQLKAFCDAHGIAVPQPRHGDVVLAKARSGYETAARKLGETAAYPGDWLYATWSESDLGSWLDTHGFPVPQPATRDKLVAGDGGHLPHQLSRPQGQQSSSRADGRWDLNAPCLVAVSRLRRPAAPARAASRHGDEAHKTRSVGGTRSACVRCARACSSAASLLLAADGHCLRRVQGSAREHADAVLQRRHHRAPRPAVSRRQVRR